MARSPGDGDGDFPANARALAPDLAAIGPRFAACVLVLMTALVFGGTSSSFHHLVVQLCALPLFYLLLRHRDEIRLTIMARIMIASVAVALLQLIPLSPAVWTALPGRAIALDVLTAAGISPGWRPLALDPGAAAMALSTLFAPLVLYVGASNLPPEQRRRLLAVIAIFGVASAMLGLGQRMAGLPPLHPSEHRGASTGLFVNRNHHADLIIVTAILLSVALPPEARRRWRWAVSGLVLAVGLSVTATTSRMGLLLAVPAVLASLALIWRPPLRYALPTAIAYLLAAAALLSLPAFSILLERLSGAGSDERIHIATSTMVALREMWPFGSGYGSFVPVYAAFEDLDWLHDRYVVAAHDDYLQIVLEGGLAGLLSLVAVVIGATAQAWRVFKAKMPVEIRVEAWAGLACAAVLLVHSAFDFPLRMAALMAVLAVSFAASDKPLSN